MLQITEVTGTGIPLLIDDIDTDRIIPARFLRCVTFDGLGEHAFEDDRQQDRSHPFDDPRYKGASVLIGGRNFGCGSSREHAPQALMRWGIKAVIAESFAEIFFGNCTTLGVPCVCAARADLEQLTNLVKADPSLSITVDLASKQVRAGNLAVPVTILESARMALTTGKWDFLGQLLEGADAVRKAATALPYLSGFKA
ncbi:MAG: 3-isopropylmalate dehydratase small subunit [Planctomycetes bacterium]|nr:3-isopropylmalate dehydratase small subunit [Planctomycetota bacterium]